MKKNGYTLIELLIVITIVAILGVIAYDKLTGRSSNGEATHWTEHE